MSAPALRLTNDLIRKILTGLGHATPETGRLHLCGVRGATWSHGSLIAAQNEPDYYNDVILAFGPVLTGWRSSVDPGRYYTEHPLNPDGCAHLMNGLHRFKPGYHLQSRYGTTRPCLVQAEPFRVWRDKNRNSVRDPGDPVQTGEFGIHLHAGGKQGRVERDSAGCQIIWGGWEGAPYRELLKLTWEPTLTRVTGYYLHDFSEWLQQMDALHA